MGYPLKYNHQHMSLFSEAYGLGLYPTHKTLGEIS
jgi:hypothetical protein